MMREGDVFACLVGDKVEGRRTHFLHTHTHKGDAQAQG